MKLRDFLRLPVIIGPLGLKEATATTDVPAETGTRCANRRESLRARERGRPELDFSDRSAAF